MQVEVPLVDGTTWTPNVEDVTRWKGAYPAVNIEAELRKMSVWCHANAKNRKTRTGINRFVNTWLSKAQDKGGSSGPVVPSSKPGFIPDYGAFWAHWEIGEQMIRCHQQGVDYRPLSHLSEYQTRFNVTSLVDAILEREPQKAYGAFFVTLSQNWHKYVRDSQ